MKNNFVLYSNEKVMLKVDDILAELYSCGYTQTEIAIQLGINDRTIRKWENHQTIPGGTQLYNLIRLCKANRG